MLHAAQMTLTCAKLPSDLFQPQLTGNLTPPQGFQNAAIHKEALISAPPVSADANFVTVSKSVVSIVGFLDRQRLFQPCPSHCLETLGPIHS